jgi:protein arginine kinase activator
MGVDKMLCDICHKNKATVHFTKIVNGKKIEMHLCKECARKNSDINKSFSMENFLSDMFGEFTLKEPDVEYKCPNCGMTYQQFKRYGKFGCSECIDAFKDRIEPLIQNIHGHRRHKGKYPGQHKVSESSESGEIEILKKELKEAIEVENYEKAAELRDRIKELGKKEEAK